MNAGYVVGGGGGGSLVSFGDGQASGLNGGPAGGAVDIGAFAGLGRAYVISERTENCDCNDE